MGLSLSALPLVSSCKKLSMNFSSLEKQSVRHEQALIFLHSCLKDFKTDKNIKAVEYSGVHSIKAESMNSKVNLNFLPESILKDECFDRYFKSPECKVLFMEELNKGNLFYSYIDMEKYMDEEKFSDHFTFYTIPNLNICPRQALEKISDGKSLFSIEKILGMQKSRSFIKNKDEMILALGVNLSSLIPYVSFKPPVDLNFADEELLLSLLSCKVFCISSPSAVCRKITVLRKSKKIDEADLAGIFKVPSNNLIYQFLGTESSCFKFKVSDGQGEVLESIVLFNDGSVKILEEKWL